VYYCVYDSVGLILRTRSLLTMMLAAERAFSRGCWFVSWNSVAANGRCVATGQTYRNYLDFLKSL
jgi:hypothetical protein